jgi:hypothetical protein
LPRNNRAKPATAQEGATSESYPGSPRGMPFCDAMEAEMKLGDILLVECANGMTVRYLLPRAN